MNHRKHPMRRTAAASAVVAATALALSACGPDITSGSPASGDQSGSGQSGVASGAADVLEAPDTSDPAALTGDITIWDRSGDLFQVFDGVIDDFNQKYPNITVHHEAVDIDSKLQNTLITGTDVPDGVFLDDAMVSGYADYLWDVSDVLAPYASDIAPQKLDATTVDGHTYGIPYDLDPGLLFYNESALSDAGIDATQIQTYDDLLDAARAYKAAKPDSGPIHLEQGAFLGQLQLEMYASQFGTSIGAEDGSVRLDSDAYRQILGFLDTASSEGLGTRAEYLNQTDVAEMENGNEVFYPWSIWFDFAPQQLLTQTGGDWRAMELPAWTEGGARSGAMGGSSFVLPKEGKNSQLAAVFYEFLMYDQAGYTAVWGPNDIYPDGLNTSIPAYLPAADPDTPLFQTADLLGGQDLWKIATAAGAEIPGGSSIPWWWNSSVDYLGNNVQKMLDGQMSPDDVITQSTADIQTNLIDRH